MGGGDVSPGKVTGGKHAYTKRRRSNEYQTGICTIQYNDSYLDVSMQDVGRFPPLREVTAEPSERGQSRLCMYRRSRKEKNGAALLKWLVGLTGLTQPSGASDAAGKRAHGPDYRFKCLLQQGTLGTLLTWVFSKQTVLRPRPYKGFFWVAARYRILCATPHTHTHLYTVHIRSKRSARRTCFIPQRYDFPSNCKGSYTGKQLTPGRKKVNAEQTHFS